MEELDHETGEALECTGYSNSWRYFDEDAFSSGDINLKLAGFIYRGIQEGKETLYTH